MNRIDPGAPGCRDMSRYIANVCGFSGVKMNRDSPFFMAGKTVKTPGSYVPTLPTLFLGGQKTQETPF